MATAATTIKITTRRLNDVWLCAATSKQVFCHPVVELPDNPEQSKLDDAFPRITTPIPSSIEAAIKIVTNVITTFSILFLSTKYLNINTLVINIMNQQKRWRQENKIHVKAQSKKYYQENKEKILQQQKEYREKNPEKTKKIRANYYQKNREEKKRKQKRRYYNNKIKPVTELEI